MVRLQRQRAGNRRHNPPQVARSRIVVDFYYLPLLPLGKGMAYVFHPDISA
jgi:hypothetical protein